MSSAARPSGACLKCLLVVFAVASALCVSGPALYWRFKKGFASTQSLSSSSHPGCAPCVCDCPPPLSLDAIAPGDLSFSPPPFSYFSLESCAFLAVTMNFLCCRDLFLVLILIWVLDMSDCRFDSKGRMDLVENFFGWVEIVVDENCGYLACGSFGVYLACTMVHSSFGDYAVF